MKQLIKISVIIFLISLIVAMLVKWIGGITFSDQPNLPITITTATPTNKPVPTNTPSVKSGFEEALKVFEQTVTSFEIEFFTVSTNETQLSRADRLRPFIEPTLLGQILKSEMPKGQIGEQSNADKAKQRQGFIRKVEEVTILSTEPYDETVTTVESFIEVTTTDSKGDWPSRFVMPESHISHWSYNGDKWIVIGLPQLYFGAGAGIDDS